MSICAETVSTRPVATRVRSRCVCAWCGATLSDPRRVRAPSELEMNFGMCPECVVAQLVRLERRAAAAPHDSAGAAIAS